MLVCPWACRRHPECRKKPATTITEGLNAAVYQQLDFSDEQETEFARRGLIAAPESLIIKAENGMTIWSQDAYDFVREAEDVPSSANPSLWRNTQHNALYGLFKVTDDIYQVRGYDISNITFVRSQHGWIIMDCASSRYTAAEALKLFREHMGEARIVTIVISHAHVDHYGGIEGLISAGDAADPSLPLAEQIASGKTAIIVPQGFVDSVMRENVFAGTAMKRRATYQYGSFLPYGAQGRLSVGIGLTAVQGGTGYIAPTYEITQPLCEMEIDGVQAIFQLTPGTESPAEMNTYFPQMQALWMAENCTGTMHNLYTLRGAEVRDANDWARYITQAQTLFPDAELVFQSHNWPHWGKDVVVEYLTNTAAVYKFMHDQTLMYINEGYTADEIAAMIELPEALARVWYTRQYYGTLKHNVKAVYQKYMGWYDANPVNLDELAPTEYAKKLMEYLGDPAKVLEMARISGWRRLPTPWYLPIPPTWMRSIFAPTRWNSWAIRRNPARGETPIWLRPSSCATARARIRRPAASVRAPPRRAWTRRRCWTIWALCWMRKSWPVSPLPSI